MFGSQGYANASRRYAAVDANSKVDGTTPYQLVKILYDELLLAMDIAILAMRGGDTAKAVDKQARALTILHALETSLDFEQGGEIATNLAIVYRESRRRLLAAVPNNDVEKLVGARDIIKDIAEAWNQIG